MTAWTPADIAPDLCIDCTVRPGGHGYFRLFCAECGSHSK